MIPELWKIGAYAIVYVLPNALLFGLGYIAARVAHKPEYVRTTKATCRYVVIGILICTAAAFFWTDQTYRRCIEYNDDMGECIDYAEYDPLHTDLKKSVLNFAIISGAFILSAYRSKKYPEDWKSWMSELR